MRFGGADYRFYLQPVLLSLLRETRDDPEEWKLCGLVRADHFQSASAEISSTYLLLLSAALTALVLAIPISSSTWYTPAWIVTACGAAGLRTRRDSRHARGRVRGSALVQSDKASPKRSGYGLRAVLHIELLQDVLQVHLYRPLGTADPVRDVRVAEPVRDEAQDFELARR